MNTKLKNIKLWQVGLFTLLLSTACNKEIATGSDPYAGGKEPLGVGFYANYANPSSARPGELVDFYVKGIKSNLSDLNFYVNDTKVEIISAQDSLITIRVPAEISSGDAKIEVAGEIFYGPRLEIDGNVSKDNNFAVVNGFYGSVYDILPNAGGFIVAGSFRNFENEAVEKKTFRNGIHFLDGNGRSSSSMNFGEGTSGGGFVNSITKMTDGKFLIAGGFGTFNKKRVYNFAKLNANGSIDSTIVDVINSGTNPKNALDTVSSFNAGVNGSVLRVFAVADNKAIAIGNFDRHFKIDYTYSSRENRRLIETKVQHAMRLKPDGSLDSTYNLNNVGANTIIIDAALIDNERVVIVGPFTTYDSKPVKGLVCLKADGSVDPSFNLTTGTIERILSVTYNAQLKKIAITGSFKGLGASGKVHGVAILNTDGSLDETFVLGDVGSGIANFAQVLNNGRVLVQGSFNTYNGIKRSGMVILEKNGTLLQQYNNQSPLTGSIYKLIETKSSMDQPALLFGGSIFQFGKDLTGNFFRVEVKD